MILDNPGIMLAACALAGVLFVIGLLVIAASVFLFVKKKETKLAGIPAWAALLAAGLILTLVIPGLILFILLLVIVLELTIAPPVVTCYAPMEDPVNTTTMAAGALIASRVELLDKLHKDGRIPESLYKKLKK